MENSVLTDYIDRVYGYSIRNTFNRDEADELSQEILCTALKQLPSLRDDTRFEPWLWGLAANVTRVFRRNQGKQRAMYSFDSLESPVLPDECATIDEELYEQIRAKIAGLSKLYREIIVLHYYDSLSCKEIAEKLGIPEGTVTWRLSEGRNKLKKECANMTEAALRPVRMDIRISGNGNYNGKDKPFPWMFIDDALSQNILYHCYEELKTVEDLSKLCGVPAYYIEDTVSKLLYREAIVEAAKGKYLTDFLIYDERHSRYNDESQSLLDGVLSESIDSLKNFTQKVVQSGVHTAGKPDNELFYLFGIMAAEQLQKSHRNSPPVPYKVKYDGNEWAYHAHIKETYKSGGIGGEKNFNIESEGTYSHHSYHFVGFAYRPMLGSPQINVCEKVLCGKDLSENEKELASELIREGYLSSHNGDVKVEIPSLTLSQKVEFDHLAESHFRDFLPNYIEIIEKYKDGYRKLFPKRLKEDVDRGFSYLSLGFFANVVSAAQKRDLLERPGEKSICDVLVQLK